MGCDDEAGIAIYQCRPHKACRGPGVAQRSFRDVPCAAEFGRFGGRDHPAICAPDSVWVEQCQQSLEVALAGGGQEGLDDLPAPGQVSVVNGPAAHSGACPACELLGGDGAAPNDAGDLGERHVEHVVQHECDPLSRREAIQHDEQRESHRVRGECFVFRVDTAAWVRDRRDVCRVQRFFLA